MKSLTKQDVRIELIAEYETIEVRGNAIDSGDAKYDKEVEDKIIEAVNNGDVWAWASVEVKATYKGLTASAYLGCCSYVSQDEFESDGYYEDMVNEVVDDLNRQVGDLFSELA